MKDVIPMNTNTFDTYRFRRETAGQLFQVSCGPYHLSKVVETYWGMVSQQLLLPATISIHNRLVELGHTESNKLLLCDCNHSLYFIEQSGIRVWVHKTPSVDFLYIVQDDKLLNIYNASCCRYDVEYFKSIGFTVPWFHTDHIYGDARDKGYLICYDGHRTEMDKTFNPQAGPIAEGVTSKHDILTLIATGYIPIIADVLKNNVPQLEGF